MREIKIGQFKIGNSHFYVKRNWQGKLFIRFHGGWWEATETFKTIYPNIELPEEIKTLIKLNEVLDKYNLKH